MAKVKEAMMRLNSKLLPRSPAGHSPIFSRTKLVMAGNESTGRGSTNLLKAVSLMAFFAAILLFPYSMSPYLLKMEMPPVNSLALIRVTFVAPAKAAAT